MSDSGEVTANSPERLYCNVQVGPAAVFLALTDVGREQVNEKAYLLTSFEDEGHPTPEISTPFLPVLCQEHDVTFGALPRTADTFSFRLVNQIDDVVTVQPSAVMSSEVFSVMPFSFSRH